MYMLRDDLEQVNFWADRVVDLANRLAFPEVRVHAEIERGSAFMNVPTLWEQGRIHLVEAVDEAAELQQWVIVARGLNNLVRGDFYRPDAEEARSLLVRMRDATERAVFDLFTGSYWDGLADLSEWEGDLGSALSQVDEALRAQRTSVGNKPAFWFSAHAAGLALEAGEVDRAEEIFDSVDPVVGGRASWWRGLGLHIAGVRGDQEAVRVHRNALVQISHTRGGIDPSMVHNIVRALLLGGTSPDVVEELLDGLPVAFGQASTRTGGSRTRNCSKLVVIPRARSASTRPRSSSPARGYGPPRSAPHTSARDARSSHCGARTRRRNMRSSRRSCWPAGAERGWRSSPRSSVGSGVAIPWRVLPS